MKKKLVFVLLISVVLLEGCANKNFVVAPTFTNVKKISTLQMGQSLNEVNQSLGIYPFDVITLSEGDLICQYKYRIMERRIPMSNGGEFHRFTEADSMSLSSELAQTYGKVFYTDWKDLYVSFKGGKLVSYTTTSGLERANYILLVNGAIKLLKDKPLEFSHFTENNAMQFFVDPKSSYGIGGDQKDRNIVDKILFPLEKDGKFKTFGKSTTKFFGPK